MVRKLKRKVEEVVGWNVRILNLTPTFGQRAKDRGASIGGVLVPGLRGQD